MLETRIKTALLLACPALAAISLGGFVLSLLLFLLYLAVQFELFGFSPQLSRERRLISTGIVGIVPIAASYAETTGFLLAALGAAILLFVLEIIAVENEIHEVNHLESLGLIGLSIGYTGALGTSLFLFAPRVTTNLVYWLLLSVVFADSTAYFVGRAFGKGKLAPRISPKKTIEGALGGLTGSVFVSLVASYFQLVPFGLGAAVFWGILIGVLALFGDLAESLLKRCYGLKDSGDMLPGHGGFLDRIDALLFCSPVLYFFQ